MPYAVSKAAQLHLMRCMAATQGPKVRVNAVVPGFLRTEWVSAVLRYFRICFGVRRGDGMRWKVEY